MTNDKSTSSLDRLAALVDRGWLGVLTDTEKSLWMAYARFSDRDGMAYPGNDTLTKIMQHSSERHIQRAKASLKAYGLIEVVGAKGGRGHACTVKVLTPPFPPQNGSSEPIERVANDTTLFDVDSAERVAYSDTKGWRNQTLKGGVIERALNKEELDIELDRTGSSATTSSSRARNGKSTTDLTAKNAGAQGEPRKRDARKLTDEQLQTRDAFTRWYVEVAFPHVNAGVKYEFAAEGSRNGKAVMTVLTSQFVGWDLLKAKQVAKEFLKSDDDFLRRRGHKLYDLAERVARFGADVVRREQGQPTQITHKPGHGPRSRAAERAAELDRIIENAMKDEVEV